MKNDSIKFAVAMLVFGSTLFSLACGGGNTVSNSSEVANVAASKDDPCKAGLTPDQKIANLNTLFNERIGKNGKLKKQKDDRQFNFTFSKFTPRDRIWMNVEGQFLGTGEGNKETTFENFFDLADGYMREGCIEKITFNRNQPPGEAALNGGSDWVLCEYPNVYCADGSCQRPELCPLDADRKTANVSTSGNANSNANSNSSSNSNSNSNGNANKGNSYR